MSESLNSLDTAGRMYDGNSCASDAGKLRTWHSTCVMATMACARTMEALSSKSETK